MFVCIVLLQLWLYLPLLNILWTSSTSTSMWKTLAEIWYLKLNMMQIYEPSFLNSNSSNFYPYYWYQYQSFFISDNLGGQENNFYLWKSFSRPKKIKLSDVNKTYIDISNGQKFELYIWSFFLSVKKYDTNRQ